MATPAEESKDPAELALEIGNRIASERDADVILFNGDLEEPWDRRLAEGCDVNPRRENVILVLVTYGGDPHAAYRIARCLERLYERFTAFVPGPCKSAGTLLVTGAHELVVADQGELGPLDIQMRKEDELWAMNSGLTVIEAMDTLERRAFDAFTEYFLEIMARSSGRIGFRTATKVSSELVSGLMNPLFAQIDPMLLGEAMRAMQIATDYAGRLNKYSRNLHEREINDLVAAFSSHGFVIDRDEARKFFVNVRAPDETERALELALRAAGLTRFGTSEDPITMISDSPGNEKDEDDDDADQEIGRDGDSGKAGEARAAIGRPETRTDGD